jgi:hypothetical protein
MFSALKSNGQKTPEQMAADLAELRVTEAGLLGKYDELALAAADGADQGAADKAHAALVAHRQTIARAEGVLEAIERRAQREQMDAAAKSVDGAWAATLAKAKERVAIAHRFQASLKAAGDDYAALAAATAATHRALPSGYPIHAAAGFAIEGDLLTGLLRIEYSRHGLPGGPNLEGSNPPTIEHRYTEAVKCIELAREQSKEAAARG